MTAIETRLKTISGLRTASYVPDQVNPPQAVVDFPGDIDYHKTFIHGKFEFEPTVIVLISKTVDRVGVSSLSDFASPTGTNSIHAAIETDPTLGGIVDYCNVLHFRRLNQEEVAGLGYFGGVFTLQVAASGS